MYGLFSKSGCERDVEKTAVLDVVHLGRDVEDGREPARRWSMS